MLYLPIKVIQAIDGRYTLTVDKCHDKIRFSVQSHDYNVTIINNLSLWIKVRVKDRDLSSL